MTGDGSLSIPLLILGSVPEVVGLRQLVRDVIYLIIVMSILIDSFGVQESLNQILNLLNFLLFKSIIHLKISLHNIIIIATHY